MEYVLLLIVIALVAVLMNSVNNKFSQLDFRLRELQRMVEALKKQEAERKSESAPAPERQPEPAVPEPVVPDPEPISKKPLEPIPAATPEPVKVFEPTPLPKPLTAQKIYEPRQSWWKKFKENNPDLEKFIGENLINKIGVLILVLGISYFVKFAIDKNWIGEPARVGIGILSGALVMGFAHRLRRRYGAFSSVLVAGALAIFYFAIAIAFHDYHLISQTVAFAIMAVITAFSCVITLSYNRVELAVLSLVGGFATPFIVSTGEGNHVVLFTYIMILDAGILAIAYFRKWPLVNILSFLFTAFLFAGWLTGDMTEAQPHYKGALAFAFGFYVLFTAINVINNIRTKGAFSALELSVLLANTFLFYTVGMVVLTPWHPELKGSFTAFLALLNLVYAWFLYKKFGLDKTAVYLLIGLTLTFVTLAVPVQFEGNYITLFWGAEAVLLLWLAQKSGIIAYRFASVVVTVLMLASLAMDWTQYNAGAAYPVLLNKLFITGLVAVASLAATLALLRSESGCFTQFGISLDVGNYRKFLLPVAVCVAYLTGLFESLYQSFTRIQDGSQPAIPALYHMLFAAALCHFAWRKGWKVVAVIVSLFSIIAYWLFFNHLPFAENTALAIRGGGFRLAFVMHYVALATVLLLVWMLYRNRGNDEVLFIKKPLFTWIGALFLVYLTSSEALMHGLVGADDMILPGQLHEKVIHYGTDDLAIAREFAVQDRIDENTAVIVKTGFPILWGILAFVLLIVGIRRKQKLLRIIALALLGITILKLFLYDIRNASETGKIVAFILLGVLILVISFVYQKIKLLVTDDKPAEEHIS
jgi:uncharacterized membrane protein